MDKSDAIATLEAAACAGGASNTTPAEATGLGSLLQPARVQAALQANDRLKLYLSVLQAAARHAAQPDAPMLDLGGDIASAGIAARDDALWLRELPAAASRQGGALWLPDLRRLAARLAADLLTMARPVLDGAESGDPAAALGARVQQWQARLAALEGPRLDDDTLAALTHGRRDHGDSLHLTVMDLHRVLNRRAAALAREDIAGARAWGLAADGSDRPRVAAFMRGLNRTRALKGDHPGLDTAATRSGRLLMIQNDIGTNDAHVLVLQVDTEAQPLAATLTYSDLHRERYAFFQRRLAAVGGVWTRRETRRSEGLNDGADYWIGTARFEAADEARLQQHLEAIGERIVYLIDWNQARKRLQAFVDKAQAVAVLEAAADARHGHRAWLEAGGERLLWAAMAAQGEAVFRLGDRLDAVLGDEAAAGWLSEVLGIAQRAQAAGQPPALVADEARLALARRLRTRPGAHALLEEHAGLLHALSQGLRDALAHGHEAEPAAAASDAERAKRWERQADHLLMQARAHAGRQPHWQALVQLLERSDDVADALEEASFVLSLVAEHQAARREAAMPASATPGWTPAVREALLGLADTVLDAVQDHVKALVIVRTLGEGSDAGDHDDFLDASWRVLQAERRADEGLRTARRALLAQARETGDGVALQLGQELAGAIEQASDALLGLAHAVRRQMFERVEAERA